MVKRRNKRTCKEGCCMGLAPWNGFANESREGLPAGREAPPRRNVDTIAYPTGFASGSSDLYICGARKAQVKPAVETGRPDSELRLTIFQEADECPEPTKCSLPWSNARARPFGCGNGSATNWTPWRCSKPACAPDCLKPGGRTGESWRAKPYTAWAWSRGSKPPTMRCT